MLVGSDEYDNLLHQCGMPRRFAEQIRKRLHIQLERMDGTSAFTQLLEFIEDDDENTEFYLWHIWFTSRTMTWNILRHPPVKALLQKYEPKWTSNDKSA